MNVLRECKRDMKPTKEERNTLFNFQTNVLRVAEVVVILACDGHKWITGDVDEVDVSGRREMCRQRHNHIIAKEQAVYFAPVCCK